MPTDWYAPNQQAVRADESGPAEKGKGGSSRAEPKGGSRAEAKGTAAVADDADDPEDG